MYGEDFAMRGYRNSPQWLHRRIFARSTNAQGIACASEQYCPPAAACLLCDARALTNSSCRLKYTSGGVCIPCGCQDGEERKPLFLLVVLICRSRGLPWRKKPRSPDRTGIPWASLSLGLPLKAQGSQRRESYPDLNVDLQDEF